MMCMTILIGLRRAAMSVMTQPYWVGSSWAVEATFGMRTKTTTRHAFKRRARAFFAARRSTAGQLCYAIHPVNARLYEGATLTARLLQPELVDRRPAGLLRLRQLGLEV